MCKDLEKMKKITKKRDFWTPFETLMSHRTFKKGRFWGPKRPLFTLINCPFGPKNVKKTRKNALF
jgi:hypothetical protein